MDDNNFNIKLTKRRKTMDKMEKWIRQAINDDMGGVYLMIGKSINDLKNETIDCLNKIEEELTCHIDHAGVRIEKTIIYFISASDENITGKITIMNINDVYLDDSVSISDISDDALLVIAKHIQYKGL